MGHTNYTTKFKGAFTLTPQLTMDQRQVTDPMATAAQAIEVLAGRSNVLVVKLELWPGGHEEHAQALGRMNLLLLAKCLRHVTLPDPRGGDSCGVCGLWSDSLTTDCPGWRVPALFAEAVFAGSADFVAGAWVEPCSCDCGCGRAATVTIPQGAGTSSRRCDQCAGLCPPNEITKAVSATSNPTVAAADLPQSPAVPAAPAPSTAVLPVADPHDEDAGGCAGESLDEALAQRVILTRALGERIAADLCALADDARDERVAAAVRDHAINLLTVPVVAAAAKRLGIVRGTVPTAAQLKRLALEDVEAELVRRGR